ncbi:MAG: ATP-dependent metallopeptidase FtsH/Yme1/Tma family protein, partial [Aggregatilineales bacterium]
MMQPPGNNQNSDEQPENQNESPSPIPPEWRKWMWPALLLFFLGWTILSSATFIGSPTGSATRIETYIFDAEVSRQNVESVVIEGNTIRGTFNRSVTIEQSNGRNSSVTRFTTTVEDPDERVKQLQENNIEYDVNIPQISPLVSLLFNWGPLILIMALIFWMMRRGQGQMNNVFGFGRSQAREYDA